MVTLSAEEESQIQQAILAMQKGQFTSWRAAARQYIVRYRVLIVHAKGRPPNTSRGGQNTHLNDAQDAALKLYCKRYIKVGLNPERQHIRAAANSILRAVGEPPVSKPWLTRWLRRNKQFLKARRSKPLSAERKAAVEWAEIESHFRRFRQVVSEYKITPQNIWNCDETGWRIGMLGGRLVFTFPSISAVYMSDPDIRESLTTIEAINAVGDRAPSFMILPGQVLLEKYFDNDIPNDVAFTTNEETGSGFLNDMIALDWFEHWEEATRPGIKMRRGIIHSGEYRILVMDGHGSHLTKEFINNCWDYKVVPFLLPVHLTYILQPLDIGIFHLMKAQHQNILAEQVRFGGCEYSRTDFLDAYNEICVRSMKKNSIIYTWESLGLVPFQPHIVLNNMRKFQPQEPSRTPEPEESFAFEWASCETPQLKLPEIQRYSAYIDSRLTGAIDGSIPLSPIVAWVVEKRNKAQSIVALNGILALEELDKRRAEEARRACHKRDGG